jgi:hypothetical protein
VAPRIYRLVFKFFPDDFNQTVWNNTDGLVKNRPNMKISRSRTFVLKRRKQEKKKKKKKLNLQTFFQNCLEIYRRFY